MRVVHWFPNFLAGGGVANSVLGLAEAQAAIGAEPWIATLAHDSALYGPLRPQEGVRVATWGRGPALGWGGLRLHAMSRGSARALRALEPDVVHIHAEFNPDNWWVPRLWTCPFVLSPHGAFHSTVLGRGASAKRLYMTIARRALYRSVQRFHALNPAERRDVATALPAGRTYLVPQGPSPAVRQALDRIGERSTDRSGPVTFMYLGRIDVQAKGLDLLVEAFARAVPQRPAARLVLVGPDWRNGVVGLSRLARRLGIHDLVEIRGQVPAEEVPRLLMDCDVYVQLSRNEGSPLSLNDALVLGRPAIVSDRVGTVSSDEIAQLQHVKVVSPSVAEAAQAIATALDDRDALRRRAGEAHAQLRGFLSWDRAARRHLEEYASLVAA